MKSVTACLCLLLLLSCAVQSQSLTDRGAQRDLMSVDVLNLSGALQSLLQAEQHRSSLLLRQIRAPRLPPQALPPKRNQPGSRFALSLDVPTNILSVLIDLAKNQDMRTKAAANAQLMARIGRR